MLQMKRISLLILLVSTVGGAFAPWESVRAFGKSVRNLFRSRSERDTVSSNGDLDPDGSIPSSISNVLGQLHIGKRLTTVDGIITEVERFPPHNPMWRAVSDPTLVRETSKSDSVDISGALSKLQMPRKIFCVDESINQSKPSLKSLSSMTLSSFDGGTSIDGISTPGARSAENTPTSLRHTPRESPVPTLSMALRIAARASGQGSYDASEAAPRPNLCDTSISEMSPLGGTLVLGERLHQTFTSTIFAVDRLRDVVVKFQVGCYDISEDKFHPLLKDFWYLDELSGLRITPHVYYISQQAKMPLVATRKTAFEMSSVDRAACHNEHDGQVRFMLMERVGESLHKHSYGISYDGKVPFDQAIKLGIDMMAMIRTLHDEGGVVHGDLHEGNVCFSNKMGSAKRQHLMLIDFGRAVPVVVEDDEVPSELTDPITTDSWLLTPWDYQGVRMSRRDDVFKVLQIIATLLNGDSYAWKDNDLSRDLARQFKETGNLFVSWKPGSVDLVDSLRISLTAKETVKLNLAAILSSVRGLSIDQRPNYEAILTLLEEIYVLVATPSSTRRRVTLQSSKIL